MPETNYQQRKDYQLKYEHQINEEIERSIYLENNETIRYRQQMKEQITNWLDTFNTKYHLTISFPVDTKGMRLKPKKYSIY